MRDSKKIRSWYRFEALAEDSTVAELYVYDVIAQPYWPDEEVVSAKQLIDELNGLPTSVAEIRVHVNSPGGDVFQAIPIANALREHRAQVVMLVEGLAASAATIITAAGNRVVVAENALVMVHNPWSFVVGEARDMRAQADALDRVRDAIIATYQWHSKLSAEDLGKLMDDVTWMDAAEAVANGFATEVGAEMKAAASLSGRILAKLGQVPEKYRDRVAAMLEGDRDPVPSPPPADDAAVNARVTELEAALQASRQETEAARAEVSTVRSELETVRASVQTAATAARDEVWSIVDDAIARCRVVRKPGAALAILSQHVTAEELGPKLTDLLAADQSPEIRGIHGEGSGAASNLVKWAAAAANQGR